MATGRLRNPARQGCLTTDRVRHIPFQGGDMRYLCLLLGCAIGWSASALAVKGQGLAEQLRGLDAGTIVLGPVREPPLAGMLGRDVKAGLRQAVDRETRAWQQVHTSADWEKFR